MKDKVVLVTGSSNGIGAETIREFAKNGANVVINYCSDETSAIELKKEVENNYNVKALTIKCDISDENQVKSMIDEIIKVFNSINILVNNAGIANDSLIEDKTVEMFRRTIDVNLIGTFLVTREVAKHMLKDKCGRIVNVASNNGIDTLYPESIDYDASKAGVISLTHNFANYYKPYINVNVVAPGWVNTPMNKNLDKDFKETKLKKIKLNRFGEPSEIAKIIYFLCSDEASYINDTIIRVDGGEKA